MAEKRNQDKAKATAKSDEAGVLASLPATRPTRLSRRGRSAVATQRKAAAPKASTDRPKAVSATLPRPTASTASRAPAGGSAGSDPTPPTPISATEPPRPQPVRAAHPRLTEPAAKAAEQRVRDERHGSGAELVSTVVQAAGELAHIGMTVTGQFLRRAVDRLPKP